MAKRNQLTHLPFKGLKTTELYVEIDFKITTINDKTRETIKKHRDTN